MYFLDIKYVITLVLILMFSDKLLAKMPRSNKKKTFLKPLPKLSTGQSVHSGDNAIVELVSIERNVMITRAITSARNHGITLTHGSSNPGTGDCAFESVIQNNNNRTCFKKNIHYQ